MLGKIQKRGFYNSSLSPSQRDVIDIPAPVFIALMSILGFILFLLIMFWFQNQQILNMKYEILNIQIKIDQQKIPEDSKPPKQRNYLFDV